MFTAKLTAPPKSASDPQLDAPRTAVESTLPWRRNSTSTDTVEGRRLADEPLTQDEFLSRWLPTGREYLEGSFASPSNTLLRQLDHSKQIEAPPRVFEVFPLAASSSSSGSQPAGEMRSRHASSSAGAPSDLNVRPPSVGSTAIVNLGFVGDDEDDAADGEQVSKL